jgi:hypothetical protein
MTSSSSSSTPRTTREGLTAVPAMLSTELLVTTSGPLPASAGSNQFPGTAVPPTASAYGICFVCRPCRRSRRNHPHLRDQRPVTQCRPSRQLSQLSPPPHVVWQGFPSGPYRHYIGEDGDVPLFGACNSILAQAPCGLTMRAMSGNSVRYAYCAPTGTIGSDSWNGLVDCSSCAPAVCPAIAAVLGAGAIRPLGIAIGIGVG